MRNDRPLEALIEARSRLIERLKAAATDDSTATAELKDLGDRLKGVDLAITECRGTRQRRTLVYSGLVVASVATCLSCTKMPTTEFEATIETSAVELHYSSPGKISGLVLLGPVTVSGFAALEVGGNMRNDVATSESLRISVPSAVVQTLNAPSSATLRIEALRDSFEIAVTSPSSGADLFIVTDSPGELVLPPTSPASAPIKVPLLDVESISLSDTHGSKTQALPLRVIASGVRDGQEIIPKGVDGLTFSNSSPSRKTIAAVESSILSAGIHVGPKLRETLLSTGDRLVLQKLQIEVLRLNLCDTNSSRDPGKKACSGVSLRLVGRAGDIKVGSSQQLRSLKPSLLEFLKDSSVVGLIWGAAVFMWGTGWSIWKAVGK